MSMMTVGELREFVAVPCRDPDNIDEFLEPLPVTDITSYPGIITLDVEGIS